MRPDSGHGVVAVVILILLALVLLLAPFGYREADRRWFFYKHRNNPRCLVHDECFVMGCPPPNGVFCHWHEEENKGVCVCQRWGLMREDGADAGSDGSP